MKLNLSPREAEQVEHNLKRAIQWWKEYVLGENSQRGDSLRTYNLQRTLRMFQKKIRQAKKK